MQIAQELYEGIDLGPDGTQGLITYMRTDSTNVSAVAQQAARAVISGKFGPEYVPAKPPVYAEEVEGRAGSARGDPPDRAAARSGERQEVPVARNSSGSTS